MNWLDFGRDLPKVKGQWTWSKYAIFTSLPQNLKNPWVDFHQTWHRGAPWGVDELIIFWARSAQGQRSKVNELGLNMLFLPRYHKISGTHGWNFIKLGTGVPWGVDELIRFWARSAQGQRSKVNELKCLYKKNYPLFHLRMSNGVELW